MPTSVTPGRILLVALGGVVGSALRHLVGAPASGIPWKVLAVNLTGALIAGLLVARVAHHAHRAGFLLPFAVVGVAGALTTFSGLVVDVAVLADEGHLGQAGAYLTASVLLGPAAAFAGAWVGRRT